MKGYGIIYTILFCLFSCLIVSATQPTKPRMIVDNKPATIDHEAADIYRAMARLPLVQYQSVLVLERGLVDTATAVFAEPFKDATYSVSLCINDSIETRTNELVVYSVFLKTTDSCMITALFVGDSVRFDLIAIGERP